MHAAVADERLGRQPEQSVSSTGAAHMCGSLPGGQSIRLYRCPHVVGDVSRDYACQSQQQFRQGLLSALRLRIVLIDRRSYCAMLEICNGLRTACSRG